MQKQQLIALLASLGVLALLIIGASWYGQKGGSRAISGTRRPGRPIVSKFASRVRDSSSRVKEGPSDDVPANGGQAEDQPQPLPEEAPPSPADQAVQEALNALSPEHGIEKIEAYLASLENLDEAARLYCALGTLYAQTDPPDTSRAEQTLAVANDLAQSPQDKHRATYLLTNMLVQRGEKDRALDEVRAALDRDGTATLPGAQLSVLAGSLHESEGAVQEAEAAYKKAMESSLAASERVGPRALDVYRQACLSLARLYRNTDRDSEAEAVTRDLKRALAQMKLEQDLQTEP